MTVSDGVASFWYMKSNVNPYDVNRDGEVNIADINAVIDHILSGDSTVYPFDVNGDGEVNIADVNDIIGVILSGL